MQMSHNCRQLPFKGLLHNYGKCHKIHSTTRRYEDQTGMYDSTEEMPAPHDTTPLDTAPTTHSIPDLHSETAAGYSEDTNL